jgi:hypothetical protein
MMESGIICKSTVDVRQADRLFAALRRARPTTRAGLKNYIKVFLGLLCI